MIRLLLILLLLSSPLLAQDELLLNFPAPDDWKKEIMALPPDFAPDLTWQGQECLRFAPGMFEAEAPDFFSYVFALVLDEPVDDLEGDLISYYSGLSRAVLKNDQLDTSWFRLDKTSPNMYQLYWLEPFATKKPQYLRLYVDQFDKNGKIWFVCASPKELDDPIWQELQLYRKIARAVSEAEPVNSVDIDKLAIATIRGLSLDMPRKANSGHSGTALSLAPLGWLLYSRVLRHAPSHPDWPNRDRLVLSNGHACVLLYALLHLCGYELSLQDLKDFRAPFSKTPGHPETWVTPGIDVSTGPLGLGLAHGVGYAIAERFKRAHFGEALFDHYTYVLCSDGDLMEGVTSEASSLAGHLKLGRLIVFYDDNRVTIDGPTADSFSEDVEARYRAYGWQTLSTDGENTEEMESCINEARSDSRPTLVRLQTTIGFPSPGMSGKPEAHSPPFSAEEIRATKLILGLDCDQDFQIPEPLQSLPQAFRDQGRLLVSEWEAATTPEWETWMQKQWPESCPVPSFSKPIATRSASGVVLNTLAEHLPNLIGGSADLAGSTKVHLTSFSDFSSQNPSGRNLRFGVREQAMASITNGLAQHGGLIPFCSTYFSFSDFMKPSIRMAALAGLPGIFVFSHDSLALGGDGPTHQPVEQLAALRALPNCLVLRPADGNETSQAWQVALKHQTGPVVLVLSRQDLPVLPAGNLERGGYVVAGHSGVTLIGAGSEVHLCMEARELLKEVGVESRVVSVPCWSLFWSQPLEYRNQVLGRAPRVAVEAGATIGWHRFVGDEGVVLGLDRFGASGPGDDLMKRFGFTPEAVVQAVLRVASSQS